MDECLIGLHWCSETEKCENTLGSFDCKPLTSCDPGYEWDPFSSSCVDIDECKTDCDGPGNICENTVRAITIPNQKHGFYSCFYHDFYHVFQFNFFIIFDHIFYHLL